MVGNTDTFPSSPGTSQTPQAPPNNGAGSWPSNVVPLALQIGWTMAVLNNLPAGTLDSEKLLSEHELRPEDRVQVELKWLLSLLQAVNTRLPQGAPNVPTVHRLMGQQSGLFTITKADLPEALDDFNLILLEAFACLGRQIALAYDLGRSLRDTVNPFAPAMGERSPVARVTAALRRGHVQQIRQWLGVLSASLPEETATIVSTSLGWWSDVAAAAFDPSTAGSLRSSSSPEKYAQQLLDQLLPQGDTWLSLLTGTTSTTGLLTPEGRVSAAEAAVNRSGRLVGSVAKHYWLPLACLAAALGGVSYLAITYLGGAAKVWTEIAAIAGSLGVTAKGITSALTSLAERGAGEMFALEEVEVKAAAITSLPKAALTRGAVAELRRNGVPAGPRTGPIVKLFNRWIHRTRSAGGNGGRKPPRPSATRTPQSAVPTETLREPSQPTQPQPPQAPRAGQLAGASHTVRIRDD